MEEKKAANMLMATGHHFMLRPASRKSSVFLWRRPCQMPSEMMPIK